LHTLEDFEKQKTIKDNTISCRYKDIIIHQCPPNGPGITVLLMMQMMEKLKIENYKANSPERFHIEAEVTKLAYQLREKNIGDPNFIKMDLEKLLSKSTVEEAVNKISLSKCYDVGNLNIPAHPETIYLTVVDKDFNAVSIINSICYVFGSGITSNNTGILFQNRGTNFLRIRCTNLVNFNSSLVISVALPNENACSASKREIGALGERYSFR